MFLSKAYKHPLTQCCVLLILAMVLSLVFGKLNRSKIALSFAINSEINSQAQIYWNTGNGWNERQHFDINIRAGNNEFHNLMHQNMDHIRLLRIDPLKNAGRFSISRIEVNYLDCLLSFSRYCYQSLNINLASKTQIVSSQDSSESAFLSTGRDPILSWRLEVARNRAEYVGIFNTVGIAFIFTSLWVLGYFLDKRSGLKAYQRSRMAIFDALPLLLIYPLLFVGFWLISDFIEIDSFQRQIFYGSLVLFIVTSIYAIFKEWCFLNSIRLTSLVVVVGLLVPEFAFHLGFMRTWPMGRREIPEYHWQLGRSFQDNYQHSSLKYLDEISEIGSLLPAGAVFLSDPATSYYLTAQLDVFMRNTLYHHRKDDYYIEDDVVQSLCNSEASLEKADVHRTSLIQKQIAYIIVNKDKHNKNLSVQTCLAQFSTNVVKNIQPFTHRIHQGKYFDVYQID